MAIYKRNCNQCGKYYNGYGKLFCSLHCGYLGRKLNIEGLKLGWVCNKGKKFPERHGQGHPMWGRKHSERTKFIISAKRIDSKIAVGNKNPNWKGGVTHIKYLIYISSKYQNWRKQIFTRDSYTCQECGDKTGGNLEAHHIKSFSRILKENNIKTLDDAIACAELWSSDNGKTLCTDCHKKTENYGRKLIIKQNYNLALIH